MERKTEKVTLLLVKRRSSPRSFLQYTTWPPCRLTCNANQPIQQRQNPVRTTPRQAMPSAQADRSVNKSAVGNPTRAEAPLGERSTTWATPFQSLTTSSPDLGSIELAKRPMLIDNRRRGKRAALGARREAEQHARAAGERDRRVGALGCSRCY